MDGGLATFVLQPAFVLSLLVGAFHTCVYVFVRGKLGWHLPFVLAGAILGALAGQAIGARIGDVLSLGDYPLAVGVRGVLAGHRHRRGQQRARCPTAGATTAAGPGRHHPAPSGLRLASTKGRRPA